MVFKSIFPDSSPPKEFEDSLSKFYWHQLDVFADKCLFEYPDGRRQHTGAEIKEISRKIGRYLVDELGIKRGDSCVTFYRNSDYTHLAALGILFAGAHVCTGYEHDPPHEHQHLLKCLRPKIVFVEASIYSLIAELRRNNELDFKICIMNDKSFEFLENKDFIGFERDILCYEPMGEKEAADQGKGLPIEVKGSDAAYVLLTSGSTGLQKPVVRTHRNSIYVCYSFANENSPWQLDQDSILCGHLPLDHGTGTFSIKMTMAKGLKLVILDGNFNLERILEAIHEFRITDCMLGAAYLYTLVKLDPAHLAKYNLSSLRNIISIGSRMSSHELNVGLMNRIPGLAIRQAYGMTETGFISIVPASDAISDGTTCGVVLPNLRISLRDRESGEAIERLEEEGELHVAGPTVSPGYLGEDLLEQSRAVFQDDGFYRSNDICSFTKEQRLLVRGRYTEILCFTDGWKICPDEIEHVICKHPKVREAVVIGLPHPTLPTLHIPRAFVVPSEESKTQLTGKEVYDFTAKLMSKPKHLTGGVFILDSLPRTSIGKPDKKMLRSFELEAGSVIDSYLRE